MKIIRLETLAKRAVVTSGGQQVWLWVRVHTDEGIVGIGETYPRGEVESALIHHALAPVLLGKDPLEIEARWWDMYDAAKGYGWAGAEMRAISAVDIALWDILGKVCNQPLYNLLGGKCRDSILTYNTCYDYKFDFNTDADRLARELLDMGIRYMKIWPFDAAAIKTRGAFISDEDMEVSLQPFRKIREACGEQMGIMAEFHGYWNLPCAIKIAKALEPFQPVWLEEMLRPDNMRAYKRLAEATSIPLNISELLMTRYQYRELMELGAAQIIMLDIEWCGGITEAKKIAALADTYYLPITPHNCGGPILGLASAHFAASIPNLFILESVRPCWMFEHPKYVTNPMRVENGHVLLPDGPGLGAELTTQAWEGAEVKVTEA